MMIKLIVLLLTIALTYAQGPIDGVYYSDLPGGPSGTCRVYAQIHFMNFLSYLGTCNGSPGEVIMGSYVIAPNAADAMSGVLSLTFSTLIPDNGGGGGPLAGTTYGFTWEFLDSGRTQLNLTSAGLDTSIVYTRTVASAIDGTWIYQYPAGGNNEIEAQSGTYLSYTTNPTGLPAAVMGTYALSAPNKIDVYIASGPTGFDNTKENGTYSVDSTSLNVQVTVEAAGNGVVTLGPYTRVPNNDMFEGVWSGYTEAIGGGGYCLTTVEFHANLYRAYQTRCDASYQFGFGTFLGTFNQVGSNLLNLTYNYVDTHGHPLALVGTTFQFTFTLGQSSSGATTLLLHLPGAADIHLTKVVTMPTQTNVDIHLQGNYSSFVGGVVTTFLHDLAVLLNIDERNIRLSDVRSGSIIVTAEISDDAHSGVSSTVSPNVIGGAGSIGNYPVIGVTNVTPGASQSGATHSVVSWLMLLALIVVAAL